VAAIKAKTDNLPASPAAVGSAMTLESGAITAAVVATGAIDADALAADAGTEIGTAVWATAARTLTAATNVTSTGAAVPITAGGLVSADVTAISTSTVAADRLEDSAEVIVSAAAAAGTLSTTQMTTNLTEATDDHYNGRIIIWTSGVLKDQATDITDYTGATKLLTFTAVTEAPTAGDTFVIV
jgi:hypothetical protein